MIELVKCSWCHTMVKEPCSTVVECKTCPEPYTLTAEQAKKALEITSKRVPLRARPLPIENPADSPIIRRYVHVDFNAIKPDWYVVASVSGVSPFKVGDRVLAYEEAGPSCDGVVTEVFDNGRGPLVRIRLDRETWRDE